MTALDLLVVDDDPSFRAHVGAVARELGCARVEVARSLADGRRALGADRPAMVLLDWELPDGSGLDLCRWLRARDDRWPYVIMATGKPAECLPRAFDAGADDVLLKPIHREELVARLALGQHTVLDGRAARFRAALTDALSGPAGVLVLCAGGLTTHVIFSGREIQWVSARPSPRSLASHLYEELGISREVLQDAIRQAETEHEPIDRILTRRGVGSPLRLRAVFRDHFGVLLCATRDAGELRTMLLPARPTVGESALGYSLDELLSSCAGSSVPSLFPTPASLGPTDTELLLALERLTGFVVAYVLDASDGRCLGRLGSDHHLQECWLLARALGGLPAMEEAELVLSTGAHVRAGRRLGVGDKILCVVVERACADVEHALEEMRRLSRRVDPGPGMPSARLWSARDV